MKTETAQDHFFIKNSCLCGIVAILALAGTASGQSFSPSSPAREYVRLDDRIVAMESGRTSPSGGAVQVLLEMVDRGISSSSTAQTSSLGTQLRLDPADYESASASYSFETVATNTDSVSRQVELLDNLSVVMASVTVPSGTTDSTRFRSATFTPNAGPTVYTIRVAQTTSSAQLKVYTGRIVVDQVGAIKTRIQIPLANYLNGASIGSQQFVDSTSSTTYGQGNSNYFSIFYRDNDRYDGVAAWEFEVVSAGFGTTGTHKTSLFTRAGTQLTTSEVTKVGGTIQLNVVDITNDANFTNLTEFEVRHKVVSTNGFLYRAALYVRLQNNFTKADVYHRISRYHTATLPGYYTDSRVLYDASKVSNATTYFESVGWENTAGGQKRKVVDMGTGDSGIPVDPPPTSVIGSDIDFPSSAKTRIRSGPFTLVSGKRYTLEVDSGGGATAASTSFVVIAIVR